MVKRIPTIIGLAICAALSGCIFLDVKHQQAKLETFCSVSGTVTSEHASDRPLVVVLVRKEGAGSDIARDWRIVDHFVLERSGRWAFHVSAGVYGLAAFEDTNRNLVYQPGEPFLQIAMDDPVFCTVGDDISDVTLTIPQSGRPRIDGPLDITKLQARTVDDQMQASLGMISAVGELARLDDSRFSEENARSGLWRPFDFLFDARPGVYFLDDYDPEKIPVLFVHGVQGTPRNFASIIHNLDRDTFQPWVYYYPSGVSLGAVADHLDQTMMKLRRRLGFDEFHVVAHSVGGLVSRSFIFRHYHSLGHATIPVFVTIASPWGGHRSAALGVQRAPAVVHSWRDLAPGSPFLSAMFFTDAEALHGRKPLPGELSHHLIFAFKRNPNSLGESNDQTVTVASQMRWEAQQDADRLYGFDENHVGMLHSERVSAVINRILADGGR